MPAKRPPATAPTLASITNFHRLPDVAHINGAACRLLCQWGRTTLWRKVRAGKFPAPIEGTHPPRWRVGDVRGFLERGAAA